MQADIADLVHPIFNRGIALRAGLEASEPLDWVEERTALKKLLAGLSAEDPADRGRSGATDFEFAGSDDPSERTRLMRTTIHYALTAWLDEFLSYHSAWGTRWRDAPLEAELYGTRTRGSKFWDEARYVQTRADGDALEVMYLCVMLGFRGDWRAKPQQVESWTQRIRPLLEKLSATWATPASLQPTAREVNLPGDWAYRGMVFAVLMAAALGLPVMLAALWRSWV